MIKPDYLRSLAKDHTRGKFPFRFTTKSEVEMKLIAAASEGLWVYEFNVQDISVMDLLGLIENEYIIKYGNSGSIFVSWQDW